MTDPSWKPLGEERPAALALLDAAVANARAEGHPEADAMFASLRPGIVEGQVPGALVRGPNGEPWGLAVWRPIAEVGRAVGPVLLAEPYRDGPGWKRLLEALLAIGDPAGPVAILNAGAAGRPEEETGAVLGPRGFDAYHRYGLTFPPGTPLPPGPSRPLVGGRLRHVGPADLEALAALSATTYAGSIDRYLFATSSDALEAARELLRQLFDGQYGRYLEEESFGLELNGMLLGAALVTRQPSSKLLADVEVHPNVQGQGHARRLIRACLEVAAREPSVPVRLAVTRENRNAFQLYQNLGFEVTEGPGTLWANSAVLGIPPPTPEP